MKGMKGMPVAQRGQLFGEAIDNNSHLQRAKRQDTVLSAVA